MRLISTSPARLPNTAHTSRPWRIHDVTNDFHLEDVWALPTVGERGDFPRLVELATSFDPRQSTDRVVRALFEVRTQLGRLFGWDDSHAGVGRRVPTLRDRLPRDLLAVPVRSGFEAAPFLPLYQLENEFAAEIANRTVHGVLHLGWVPDEAGGYRGQLAILVKPNGLLGKAYLAAIRPFRHLIVYPHILRELGDAWRKDAHIRHLA